MTARQPGWVRPTIDYAPVILFFIAFRIWGLMPATAILVAASILAVVLGLVMGHRLAWAPIVTTAIVVVFGGLTLIFNDETFVKMKPTIVEGLFAVTLWIGLLLKRPLLQHLMGQGLKLDPAGWRKLEFRFALFCAGMAVLNEIVWRTQSTDLWVDFKLGLIGLTVLFMFTQLPLIKNHMLPDDRPTERDSAGIDGADGRP
jgi:intracellular septation protein